MKVLDFMKRHFSCVRIKSLQLGLTLLKQVGSLIELSKLLISQKCLMRSSACVMLRSSEKKYCSSFYENH